MKFAIALIVASIACIHAQAQPFGPFAGGNPFVAANPFAQAYNPYLNGMFDKGAAAADGTKPAAAPAAAAPAPAPFSVSVFFQSLVLQKEADRLLSQPNFPEDLKLRVQNTLTTSETGFSNCNTATLPWLQIRCIKPALTAAKNELKAIDDEWLARPTPASNPAAPA